MTPAPQNDALLTVGRWCGTYHVPRDYFALQNLQCRVDSIVADRLSLACQSLLEHSLSNTDPSVWRIRNLALNFYLDAGFSDAHAIARDWGRSLAAEIVSIVESGEVSDTILHFPTRAAFLAHFLSDLGAGQAWGKWYYEEFADLRVLSRRQAICAIFLRRDAPALELLLQIASIGRLETVLQVLSDADARVVFDLCFEGASVVSHDDELQKWTGIVIELWNTAPLRAGSPFENRFGDALRLLARTLTRFPAGRADMQLKTVIDGLLELRRVLSGIHSPALMDALIKNLAAGDIQSAIELATGAGACDPTQALAFFAEMMQGDADWASQAAAVILGESNQKKFLNLKIISEGESLLSSAGGIFLLGPSLIALGLEEFARAAAEPVESPEKTAAILRHLTACKCLGRSRFDDTSDDPALRLFSGFDGTSFREALESLSVSQLNLAAAHCLLQQILLGLDESDAPILFADLVSSTTDNRAILLRDLRCDEWLDLVPLSADDRSFTELLKSSLYSISKICNLDRAALFLSDALSPLIDTASIDQTLGPFVSLHRLDDPAQENLAKLFGLTLSQLSFRIHSAAPHFPYFSFSGISPGSTLDPNLDCTFTLISRAALRHFVRKLFGFECSSPDHTCQNFLSGLSEIRRMDQRLEVRLSASPLSLILRMAGLQGQRYTPSWLKGMEVWLLPPQE